MQLQNYFTLPAVVEIYYDAEGHGIAAEIPRHRRGLQRIARTKVDVLTEVDCP